MPKIMRRQLISADPELGDILLNLVGLRAAASDVAGFTQVETLAEKLFTVDASDTIRIGDTTNV